MKPVLTGAALLALSLAVNARALAQSSSTDACRLLTAEEAGNVLGLKVLPGQPISVTREGCIFAPGKDHSLGARWISVILTTSTVFEGSKQSFRGLTSEPATGVGLEAHYMKMSAGKTHLVSLYVRTGKRMVHRTGESRE